MPTPSTAPDVAVERHDDAAWRRSAAERRAATHDVFGRRVPMGVSTLIGAP